MAPAGAKRLAALAEQAREFHKPILLRLAGELRVLAGQVPIVHRLHLPSGVFLHIAALPNPLFAQGRQTFLDRAVECRVSPWSRAVIDPHRFIRGDGPGVGLRRRNLNLTRRHLKVFVDAPRQENFAAVGQLFAAVRFERFFGRDHTSLSCKRRNLEVAATGKRWKRPPFASITWSRFNGSSADQRRTLSLRPGGGTGRLP